MAAVPSSIDAPTAVDGAHDAPLRWRDDRAGLAAAIALAAVLGTLAFVRISNHWSGAFDLGLFDQGVWLLSEGRAPELTILPENLFGDHLSPILVAYAPLYRLHASPLWLVGSQVLALAATVLPMRSLARDLGAPPAWATIAVCASAPVHMASLYDFHPVVLTVPVVTWGIVAARRDDVARAVVAALLVGLIRADAGVLVLGIAVLATPRVRVRIVPIALASMALGALVPVLLHTDQTFERYYGSLGTGPLDALTHPWRIVTTLLGEQALRTAALSLVPVGFLPLLRPRWALAAAVAGLPLLLSTFPNTSLAWFHHAATIAPFAIGGALAALAHHRQVPALRVALGVGLALALVTQGPLGPDAPRSQRLTGFAEARPAAGLDEAVARVRPDDRVAAEVWIVPEVARRTSIRALTSREADGGLDAAPGVEFDVVLAAVDRTELLEARGWDVARAPGADVVVARPADDA